MQRITAALRFTSILLFTLCPHQLIHAQWVPIRYVSDKEQIIRAVLEAGPGFARPRSISAANIGPLPSPLIIAGRKVAVVDPAQIEARSRGGIILAYVVFRSYEARGDHLLVSVSQVSEGQPCFGGWQHNTQDYTYRVRKVDGEWRAELVGQAVAGGPVDFRVRARSQSF